VRTVRCPGCGVSKTVTAGNGDTINQVIASSALVHACTVSANDVTCRGVVTSRNLTIDDKRVVSLILVNRQGEEG